MMKNWLKENKYVFFATFVVVMCFMRMWTYKGVEVSFVSVANQPVEYGIVYDSAKLKHESLKQEIKQYVSAGVHLVHFKVPTKKMKEFELLFDNPDVGIGQVEIKGKNTVFFEKVDDFKLFIQEVEDPHLKNKTISQYSLNSPQNVNVFAVKKIHWFRLILISVVFGGILFLLKQVSIKNFTKIEFIKILFLTILLTICSSFLFFETSFFHVLTLKFSNRGLNVDLSFNEKMPEAKFKFMSVENELNLEKKQLVYSKLKLNKFLKKDWKKFVVEIMPLSKGIMSLNVSSYRKFPIVLKVIKIDDQIYSTKSMNFLANNYEKIDFEVFKNKTVKIELEAKRYQISSSELKNLTGFSRTKFLCSILLYFLFSVFLIKKIHKLSLIDIFCFFFCIASILFLIFWSVKGVFALDNTPAFFLDFVSQLWSAEQPYFLKSKLGEYPPLIVLLYRFFSTKAIFSTNTDFFNPGEGFRQLVESGSLMYFIFWQGGTVLILVLYITLKKIPDLKRVLMIFIFITNLPMLMAFRSGNQIILCAFFLSYYLFHYDDSNRYKRESAFLCLAIAAGIKIYPAFFGLLTLYRGNNKETVRLILYGILFFILPFLTFDGGFENIKLFFVEGQKSWHDQFSGLYSFRGLTKGFWDDENIPLLVSFLGRKISDYFDKIFYFLNAFFAIVGIVNIPFEKTKWKKMLFLTLMIIVVLSKTFPYLIVLMFPTIVSFIKEETKTTISNKVFLFSMAVFFYPNLFIHRNLSTCLVGNIYFIFLAIDLFLSHCGEKKQINCNVKRSGKIY